MTGRLQILLAGMIATKPGRPALFQLERHATRNGSSRDPALAEVEIAEPGIACGRSRRVPRSDRSFNHNID